MRPTPRALLRPAAPAVGRSLKLVAATTRWAWIAARSNARARTSTRSRRDTSAASSSDSGASCAGDVTLRAERLRVALVALTDPVRVRPEDDALLDEVTSDDLHLAAACLDAEAALRATQAATVEHLLHLVADGAGDLDARVLALDDRALSRAVRDLLALCWMTRPDDG